MYLTQPYNLYGIPLESTILKITGISLNPDSYERTLTINRYTNLTMEHDIEQFQVTITVDHTESGEYYDNLLELPQFANASLVSE